MTMMKRGCERPRCFSSALSAGLQAQIKIPVGGKNDFNDLLRSA